MTYQEELNEIYRIWDQFDFEDFLDIYEDLDEMMYKVENKYQNDSRLPYEWRGEIFNFSTIEDFADYLRQRYPKFHIDEVTTYRIWR